MVCPTRAISCEGRTDLTLVLDDRTDGDVSIRVQPPYVSCIALLGRPVSSLQVLRLERAAAQPGNRSLDNLCVSRHGFVRDKRLTVQSEGPIRHHRDCQE